jgi:hypothetical protein
MNTTQDLEEIADYPLPKLWEHWDKIFSAILPENYELRDAIRDSGHRAKKVEAVGREEWCRYRMRYLSDRLDPARGYWLDFELRILLGIDARE